MSKLSKLLATAKPQTPLEPLKVQALESTTAWLFDSPKSNQFALVLKQKDGSSILGLVVVKFEDFQVGGWTTGKVLFKGTLPTSEMYETFELDTGIERDDIVDKREREEKE